MWQALKPETKWAEFYPTGGSTSTAPALVPITNGATQMFDVSAIPEGDDVYQREGRKIRVKALKMYLDFRGPEEPQILAGTEPMPVVYRFRFVVIQLKQPAGTTLPYLPALLDPTPVPGDGSTWTGDQSALVYARYRFLKGATGSPLVNFKVIKDKVYTIKIDPVRGVVWKFNHQDLTDGDYKQVDGGIHHDPYAAGEVFEGPGAIKAFPLDVQINRTVTWPTAGAADPLRQGSILIGVVASPVDTDHQTAAQLPRWSCYCRTLFTDV